MVEGNPFAHWASLKTISVSENHPCFSTEDGVLYTRDNTALISYPARHAGESFSVPSFVTRIGKQAFRGASTLTQVFLSGGLTEIGDAAFFGMDAVTCVSIPGTVTTIEGNPFYGMYRASTLLHLLHFGMRQRALAIVRSGTTAIRYT